MITLKAHIGEVTWPITLLEIMINQRRISSGLLWVFLFPFTSSGADKRDNTCGVNCQPNGSCQSNGQCLCEPGFAGADCSFPYQTCPDGILTCFDGAECTRLSTRLEDDARGQYECDCSFISDLSPFQIDQCEAPESEACITGETTSSYAFCTNGGKCIKYVETGEPHAGCRCQSDFEGRHCQYRKGTAPEAELKIAFAEKQHHLEGFLLFIIVAIVGCVVGGFGWIIFSKTKKGSQVTTMKDVEDSTKDLQLEVTDMEEKAQGEMT